jgi:hypothetical protein
MLGGRVEFRFLQCTLEAYGERLRQCDQVRPFVLADSEELGGLVDPAFELGRRLRAAEGRRPRDVGRDRAMRNQVSENPTDA